LVLRRTVSVQHPEQLFLPRAVYFLLQYKAWTAVKALVGSNVAGRKRFETPAVAVLAQPQMMEAIHMVDAAIPLLNIVILGSFMAFGIRELAQVSQRVTVEADSPERR
jgi:hypothetical protein